LSPPPISRAALLAAGSSFGFDADMRVMQGKYVGEDGRVHEGSFGFI
jgi:hypothetical protein